MIDLLFVSLTIVFLLLSWGFIVFCDRLMENKK
jgi:succinate-acetate transporter protein